MPIARIKDKELRNKVIQLLQEGVSIADISKNLNVPYDAIRSTGNSIGLMAKDIFKNSGTLDRICQLLSEGLPYHVIANKMNQEGYLTVYGKKFKKSNVFKFVKSRNEDGSYNNLGISIVGNTATARWKRFHKKAVEMHGDKFSYDEASFVNMNTEMNIFCNNCKCWEKTRPLSHLGNSEYHSQLIGCRNCNYNILMGKKTEALNALYPALSERLEDGIDRIENWLKTKQIRFTRGKIINAGTREIRFDYFLEDLNIFIDYHSEFEMGWFERPPVEYQKFIDRFRENGFKIGYCMSQKIRMAVIAYFQDIEKTLEVAINTIENGESFFPLVGEAIQYRVEESDVES